MEHIREPQQETKTDCSAVGIQKEQISLVRECQQVHLE